MYFIYMARMTEINLKLEVKGKLNQNLFALERSELTRHNWHNASPTGFQLEFEKAFF